MIIVTGSDSSLGQQLMGSCPHDEREGTLGVKIVGMSSWIMAEKRSIDERVLEIIAEHGSIDKVINNYGTNHLSWIGKTDVNDDQILINNVMGPYWVINALVKAGQVCQVVNVASATYRVPQRCTALYCASKAALVQMTRVMARELAPQGWTVNAIAPGLIEDTRMARFTNEQVLELRGWSKEEADTYARKLIPMGRYTSREEVADAIWKIFDLPPYINGTIIDMMGGV